MTEPTLNDLLKLHSEEVRFQVQLTWDRAKSSLAFHVAVLAGTAALRGVLPTSFTVLVLGFVAISALLGARMIHVGHGYYRAARDRRAEIEAKLGPGLGFVSTPGMRNEPSSRLNVTNALILQHFLIALLAVGGLLSYLLNRPAT